MRDYKKHKLRFSPYLEKLYQSDKPMIIYKFGNKYKIFTDFSKKIILNNSNINGFLNSFSNKKYKKEQDLFIGFFGYEILCNLLNIRLKNQKKTNFYKGIFYKPETVITISDKVKISSNIKQNKFNNKFNPTKILSPFKINTDFNKYKRIFNLFSKKIKQGETYQIKICTKYKNNSIVSCSPETLIEKRGLKLKTKPIAGTLKKNSKLNKSKALSFFKNNNKETKEHNMIVDMERNDLSRICKPGTVRITRKKYVEEYKHLFHYVTTIEGNLRKKIKLINIIKSMMPGGSVIGCPKIRTLELLNSQEKEDRNIFTGSFGFIKFNEDLRFNIIIRSILNFQNKSEISAASGVVLESSPKKEFNENFIKAKSLLELFK